MKRWMIVCCLFTAPVLKAQIPAAEEAFAQVNNPADWKLSFQDEGTANWRDAWFVDGYRATVSNSETGMLFSAGPVDGDHACHAVLWTKQSFEGDIKITYDYTRTDAYNKWVNILYIGATGIDSGQYVKDLAQWRELRAVPYMNLYFNYTKALHISYAAYGNKLNEGPDYIRARVYPVKDGANFAATTELPPTFFDTQLFEPGKTYNITVIRKKDSLFFNVKGGGHEKVFAWSILNAGHVKEGRIGLRHMFARSALYKNFRVYSAY